MTIGAPYKMLKRAYYRNKGYNLFILLGFIIYSFIMINLLFLRGHYNIDAPMRYNIVPFHTINQYLFHTDRYNTDIWVKNLFGNIILFIPLGVCIPTLNKRFMRVVPFTLLIIGIIFSVELIQMVTRVGSFDVDDIILNTFGALIGMGITACVYRVLDKQHILR